MRATISGLACLVALVACAPADAPPSSKQGLTDVMPKLMTWSDLLNRPRPEPTHTVQWGKGKTDVADLWLPDGAGPHPVVLMVHGGCWQKAIADRTLMNYAAEALRVQGMAVWNIEYRGVDEDGGGYPGTYLDVAGAADALRDVGATYNLKTDRVVAFGHSAGGHLALWLAARPKLPASSPLRVGDPLKIYGVLNSGGLADLKASAPVTQLDCLADIMDKLTGAPSEARPDVFSDTSPAEMLPLGVEQVAVNGDLDRIAPASLGSDLIRRVAEAGEVGGFLNVPGAGHVELVSPGTRAFDAEIDFLKEMLGVS